MAPPAECGGIFTQWDPYSAADLQKLKGRECRADFMWNAGLSCFEGWEEDSIVIFLSPGESLLSIKSPGPPAVLCGDRNGFALLYQPLIR